MNEEKYQRLARGDSCMQRRIVSEPEVFAKPDEGGGRQGQG